ncbi:transposase [Candidatus Chloroploca sp. Khr17]|uniref:transposase n=1 Tax=Candidatus Chloroploca sp. Khr17 TaxID=2496869 RepID=UPI00101D4C25|nr:transposase [Candidatus Chloroploca sp. Khr17]
MAMATIGSAQRIPCQLVVVPVAAPVAEQRRRQLRQACQRKGRTPSAQALALCDWLITVTNIPADQAMIDAIVVLLRLRWQIELVFKVWKGDRRITLTAAQDVTAVQVELYATWCGLILAHWGAIVGAWHMLGWSMMTALTIIRRSIRDLNRAIQAGTDLTVVLQEIATALQRERLQCRGDDRLNHAELLAHPAALGLAEALAAADLAYADASDA